MIFAVNYNSEEEVILSIDPGKKKVGVAVLSSQGEVWFRKILTEEGKRRGRNSDSQEAVWIFSNSSGRQHW